MPKAILAILDGYGQGEENEYNAVYCANTPFMDYVKEKYNYAFLKCSSSYVGLPDNQMGNSEVGHLNLGAGRVVYQDLTRITKSIKDGDFFENSAFLNAVENVKKHDSSMHIMGLVSDGGVHSSIEHLKALIKLCKENDVKKLYIHCFTDGRDTLPTSGINYIKQVENTISELSLGKIATITGRFYAMDRDKRYDRLEKAYNVLLLGEGEYGESAEEVMNSSYENDITDEFILPHIIDKNGIINDGDSVIFFNFRADRAREITSAVTQDDFDGFERKKRANVYFVCMSMYDESLKNVDIAYKPEILHNTLGEYLSSLGKKQLRIAETEKYAHVTYFFNGGIEKQYENEDRILIASPKVATYDLQPEMSAYEVTEKLCKNIKSNEYDFILVNFANCDMVGHTGVMSACVKAVETVDECMKKVYDAAKENGYTLMITADHGNAEVMFKDGEVITSHTTNDVIFAVCDENGKRVNCGSLKDVAPTVLCVMDLDKPEEMSGVSLI